MLSFQGGGRQFLMIKSEFCEIFAVGIISKKREITLEFYAMEIYI